MGKGSTRRASSVSQQKFNEAFDQIFGKKGLRHGHSDSGNGDDSPDDGATVRVGVGDTEDPDADGEAPREA